MLAAVAAEGVGVGLLWLEEIKLQQMLRPESLYDILNLASANGAKALTPPLPLLQSTIIAHTHVSASVKHTVHNVFVAHCALARTIGSER